MDKLINKIKEKKEQIKIAIITFWVTLNFAMPVFAAPAVGENAANWFLEQAFWLIIIFVVLMAMKYYQGGNSTKMWIVIVVGGILLFLVKNPTMLETFGNWAAEILGVR